MECCVAKVRARGMGLRARTCGCRAVEDKGAKGMWGKKRLGVWDGKGRMVEKKTKVGERQGPSSCRAHGGGGRIVLVNRLCGFKEWGPSLTIGRKHRAACLARLR